MLQENEFTYETHEVPGIGQVKTRQGTSVAVFAGAAKYWSDKAKTAYVEGFTGGAITGVCLSLCLFGIYLLLR